jgi:hypothetical protein
MHLVKEFIIGNQQSTQPLHIHLFNINFSYMLWSYDYAQNSPTVPLTRSDDCLRLLHTQTCSCDGINYDYFLPIN